VVSGGVVFGGVVSGGGVLVGGVPAGGAAVGAPPGALEPVPVPACASTTERPPNAGNATRRRISAEQISAATGRDVEPAS
jgi:hypothetical protein